MFTIPASTEKLILSDPINSGFFFYSTFILLGKSLRLESDHVPKLSHSKTTIEYRYTDQKIYLLHNKPFRLIMAIRRREHGNAANK